MLNEFMNGRKEPLVVALAVFAAGAARAVRRPGVSGASS